MRAVDGRRFAMLFKRNLISSFRKCPHDNQPTDEGYLCDIRVTNISESFTHKMAAKSSWHRYETKLRHCHPLYRDATKMHRVSVT